MREGFVPRAGNDTRAGPRDRLMLRRAGFRHARRSRVAGVNADAICVGRVRGADVTPLNSRGEARQWSACSHPQSSLLVERSCEPVFQRMERRKAAALA